MLRTIAAVILLALASPAGVSASPQSGSVIEELASIRLDRSRVYSIRDITIRRDVLSISFNRGTIAFTQSIGGTVTGAVFIGSGDILAIPPGPTEKQQLHRFTRSALLNEHFETAVLRFTDGTYDEILKQYAEHAPDEVDAADLSEVLRWDSELQRRARFIDDRILADLLGTRSRPLFLAQIEGESLGWFDAIYDERRVEEVLIEQSLESASLPRVWASFNRRDEVNDPEAHAHDDKSEADVLSYSVEGAAGSIRLRSRVDGERVVVFPAPRGVRVQSAALEDATPIPLRQTGEQVSAVLPEPMRKGQEIRLRLDFDAPASVSPVLRAGSATTILPASYRDQWIIDGLSNYPLALAGDGLARAKAELLLESPEGGSYDSLGPVSIGYRRNQPLTTPAYAASLTNKSVWILHMLRLMMQQGDDASPFAAMLADLTERFGGKTISTYEFKRLVEAHSGKDLDGFFDQWVFGTGIPIYTLEYSVEPVPNGFAVAGRIVQSGVPAAFSAQVPIYADDSLLGSAAVSSDGGDFRFVVKSRPQAVQIDPKGTLLAVTQ